MSTTTKCKTKYLAKSAIIYTAVSAGLILSAKVLFAQEARSITIVPPGAEFRVDPGGKTEGILKVVNSSNTPLTFKAQIKDFIVDDTVGTPHILPDNTLSKKYSASAWIAVSPDTFTIEPGKTQQVNYYLQVPSDARPGGHYAAVVYQPQEVIGVRGTGAGVETHLGTLFYVRVNGDIVENATVTKFSPENAFSEYGPVKINTQIANYSDSHIRPIGIVVVKNLLGQTIFSGALDEHNIFPEASRDFTTEVGDKLMFGPYTAELRANYGTNNNLTLFASTTFFVLPWKIAGIALLGIIAIVLLIIFLRRRKKSAQHQTTPPPAPQA
ncbi:MAG: hypothetical protein Q7T74_01670 [Candidatus Saccharibacteria bacterium]|nr:hypothetical protein [Candidatus Saccharibacteria bacterium]